MTPNKYCVIMAGGIGSRFWPMSRVSQPKQFIDILGTGESLLQSTYRRVRQFCEPENILIVTNEKYREITKEQVPEISDDFLLTEPLRRDTAPCIAYACSKIYKKDPNAVVAVVPSDHLVAREIEFQRIMTLAMEKASDSNNVLLTLGIKPTSPATGYGYIQYDDSINEVFKLVKTFTEKPTLELAQTFVESGEFVWNSGMFVFSVKAILNAFDEYQPEIIALFKEAMPTYFTDNEKEAINLVYTQCKSISIDYGIMEKANNVMVAPVNLGWSDLGTWSSLYEHSEKSKGENVIVGKNVMAFDAKKCIINAPQERLVVVGNVENLIITEYDDMILVCRIDEEQKIKHFVNEIKIEKGEKFT